MTYSVLKCFESKVLTWSTRQKLSSFEGYMVLWCVHTCVCLCACITCVCVCVHMGTSIVLVQLPAVLFCFVHIVLSLCIKTPDENRYSTDRGFPNVTPLCDCPWPAMLQSSVIATACTRFACTVPSMKHYSTPSSKSHHIYQGLSVLVRLWNSLGTWMVLCPKKL